MESSTRRSAASDNGIRRDMSEPVSEDEFVTKFMKRRKRKNTRRAKACKEMSKEDTKASRVNILESQFGPLQAIHSFVVNGTARMPPGHVSKEAWLRERRVEAGLAVTLSFQCTQVNTLGTETKGTEAKGTDNGR